MIPTKTGAAAAVGLVLPELKGKLDGFAIRVPTINVSLVDLTFTAKRATSVEEINSAACRPRPPAARCKGILAYNEAPLVSVDFNHDPHSSIFDATHDQGDRRHAGQGVRLVRQRVGLLQPHARYHARLVAGQVRADESPAHERTWTCAASGS